jgi:hypothetical protein
MASAGSAERLALMTTTLETRRKELDAVTTWRLDQLLTAGYAFDAANLLSARTDVDLHLAVRLLVHGCPPKTALRILL